MAKLRRFDNHLTIIYLIVGGLVFLAILGGIVFIARSPAAPADATSTTPDSVVVDEDPPVSTGSEVPRSGGGSSGSSGSAGGDGGAAAVPPVRIVDPAPDPDTPVSSDDPLPAPPSPAPPSTDGIDSFEECAAAGYPIAESYPEQCFVPGGRGFTRTIPASEVN